MGKGVWPLVYSVKSILIHVRVHTTSSYLSPAVTTRCVITELKLLGKELSGAMYVAKRFQLRKCNHERKRKSATECILALIGQSVILYV